MNKLTALILFLFSTCYIQAQYNNQSPITINGIVCLLHYNGDNSVKHPLILFFQGAGQYGADPTKALTHGTGWAIQNNKWNPDSVFNFKTNQYESFIVLSTLSPSSTSSLSFAQIDGLITYMRNNYPVDSNCLVNTGLSRGGSPATYFGAHVSNSNCCPATYVFTTPKNILCAQIPMSAEILDSAAGVTQPVQFEVSDSIPVWGWSDSNDCQSHGLPIKHWVAHVNRLAPSLGSLYTHFHSNVQCHGGWDSIYTATTRQVISGHPMNIYEWALFHRRGAPVTPPTNTVTIGSIAQSSFCVTPTQSASFSVTFTTTGTFNASNTFNVQMSDATGSFSSFINVGTGTSPISCIIPANTTTGANYKFRIQSSNPIVTSSPSPIKVINLAANKIVPTGAQTISINVAGNTLTVRDSSTGATHQWYNNSVAIAGQTGTTYTPLFTSVGVDTITCKSTFSCSVQTSNKVIINVVNPSSSKIYVTRFPAGNCGVYNWSFANPGDTLVLDPTILGDTVCTLRFINLNGTAAKHITIISENGVIKCTGSIALLDCHYVDINFGTQTGLPIAAGSISLGHYGSQSYSVPYGLECFGVTTGGAGVEIRGKDSNITVSNIYVHDKGGFNLPAGYGVIIKNDPQDYGCDFSYDYPNTFKNITLHDMFFYHIDKDVMYFGFSGGYNTNGQPVVCNGITYYPRPAQLADIICYNLYCKDAGRSMFQIGNTSGGKITIHDCYGENLGHEITGAQGAFAACGLPDSSISIYNCGANRTYLHSVYFYGYGTDSIFNNKFDSAGYCIDTNNVLRTNAGQSNVAFFPQTNIYKTKLQFNINNNLLNKSTSNFNIRIDYGTSNGNYALTGNSICGNVAQAIYTGGVPVNYDTCAAPQPDTVCTTTQIQHDTASVQTFQRIIVRDSVVIDTLYDSITYIHLNKIKYRVEKHKVVTKTVTYTLRDTTYYDSVVNSVTPLHDTTICVITGFNFNRNTEFKNDIARNRYEFYEQILAINSKRYYLG